MIGFRVGIHRVSDGVRAFKQVKSYLFEACHHTVAVSVVMVWFAVVRDARESAWTDEKSD